MKERGSNHLIIILPLSFSLSLLLSHHFNTFFCCCCCPFNQLNLSLSPILSPPLPLEPEARINCSSRTSTTNGARVESISWQSVTWGCNRELDSRIRRSNRSKSQTTTIGSSAIHSFHSLTVIDRLLFLYSWFQFCYIVFPLPSILVVHFEQTSVKQEGRSATIIGECVVVHHGFERGKSSLVC